MSAASAGFDSDRFGGLVRAIERDIAQESYDGAIVLVGHRGQVVQKAAIGYAHRATQRAARTDDVYLVFSIAKTMTAAAVLAAIDRGAIALTTPVVDLIPEFGAGGKQHVTVAQLLTHTSGMATHLPALSAKQAGNLAMVVAAASAQPLQAAPGAEVRGNPLGAYAVLGELVRRLDGKGRAFRQILAEDFFEPLGMHETALGRRADLATRCVPVVLRDPTPGLFDAAFVEAFSALLTEEAEVPGAGVLSTARDIFTWAEFWRGRGAAAGRRFLSPTIVDLAASNHTGAEPNRLFDYQRELYGWPAAPAYLGLGLFLHGEDVMPTPFGLTASPGTFGGLGAGSAIFWVDPVRDLTFVCLTAGLMEEGHSTTRFQQLSDLAIAAVPY